MNHQTKLVFCLAHEKDEGICCLGMIEALCNAHNGFLDVVREREKDHIRSTYRENRRRAKWNEAGGVAGMEQDAMDVDQDAMDEEE